MSTEYNYDERKLNFYLDEIINKLKNNQKLLKLLIYNELNPYTMPDVDYERQVKDKCIYNNPFADDEPSDIAKTQMNVMASTGRLGERTKTVIDTLLCFRILSHKNVYSCDYGSRPAEIMYELQKTLNEENIGVCQLQYDRFIEARQGNNYAGYDVYFVLKEFNKNKKSR